MGALVSAMVLLGFSGVFCVLEILRVSEYVIPQ
jgi:hypothetical protein